MRILFSLFLFVTQFIVAQTETPKYKKSQFYATWGYTSAAYSKSDIHFQNLSGAHNEYTGRTDYYDFTIHQATAHDRNDFYKIKDVANITIPQFVLHAGYYFSEKWGFEMNYDHTKYVVDDNQKVRVTGQFNNVWVDNDTLLDPATFLHFEHTDGANFWMVNLIRKWKLYEPNVKFQCSWLLKPGAGIVLPRTDVTLFGQNLNNDWKVAGYIVGLETGLRLEFLKYGVFELVSKGTYANYVNAFVIGKGNGKASHHFFCTQITASIGLKFGK